MRAALLCALAAALALAFVLPAPAGAHAVLEETVPDRGASVAAAPRAVVFRFNEAVEGSLGGVRVFDADGKRVDENRLVRPGGSSRAIGVALPDALFDGAYAATYRIVSADGHPIRGGFVFTVGDAQGAAAPAVDDLIGDGAGPVTDAAFGLARGVVYAATAALIGGLGFLLLVWRPGPPPPGAARRARRTGAAIALAGAAASAAGLVLQGASATGASFWSTLDPDVLASVLDTRFGEVWAARGAVFALGAAALALAARGHAPAPKPSPAAFHAGPPPPRQGAVALAVLGAAALAVAPALAGHAGTVEPVAALLPLDVVHVVAMALWLGGLATLLTVVPAATRVLDPPQRSALLARLLLRFSPLALACVATLLVTGTAQAVLHLDRLGALADTAFGRAIVVKVLVLGGLVALGALQRQRVLPALRRAAAGREAPGAAGRLLRTTLRAEVALAAGVLAATAALVAYPPPESLAGGPFSTTQRLGPLTLDATVDPARTGRNELHVYLLDARTGTPFAGTKELRVSATLPARDIGPVAARPRRAGPGHYVVDALQLVPRGRWRIEVVARVSEFEEHRARLKVPVE